MRKLYTIIVAVLVTASVFAQAPQKMSYQAVIRNSSNQLVTSHAVGMKISILQGSATGTVVYTETQIPTTNANGLVTLEFGGLTGFDAINWANGLYFIKTETDPTGGTNYTIAGTSQLLSVPYAMNAKNGITTAQTSKLAGIADGAEVNVNADWNATSGDAMILNKPTNTIADGSETKVTAGTNTTITGSGTTASPYVVNATSGGGGFAHYVGERYGGGIVVAVWKESGVEHGLIASLTDVSASAQWSSITSASIGAAAQSPIDGQANTTAIVAQGDASGAAYLCDNYSSGGFNDWYLPAAWELNQCYNAAFIVNTILGAPNGFQFTYYWSSTESLDNYAWNLYFYDGGTGYGYKYDAYRVRAVRRF